MSTEFTEAWQRGPNGTEFYTRTYTPATTVNAGLVFVHGFIEHIARYEHVFPSYAQNGIAVFAFDQRGFGRTALDPGEDGKREKERVSRKEGYGRTSSGEQKLDIGWALEHAKTELASKGKDGQNLPLFLMGHSMGGGLVLSFGVSPPSSFPHKLAGVIATSPLIAQTHAAPKLLRKVGSLASSLSPWTTIPAGVKPEDLSHDKEISKAYMKDPLIKQYGTLRGISTMLSVGDHLSTVGYKSWPVDLPVLIVHGGDDQVTSHLASQQFYNNVKASDKAYSLYEGGFHELQNEPQLKQRLTDEIISWVTKHTSPHSTTASDTPDARL